MLRTKDHTISLDYRHTQGLPILKYGNNLIPYTKLKHYFEYTEPQYVPYLKSWLNVHPNQYDAGVEIVDYFLDGTRTVVLLAEMQSGKTGATRYVVHVLKHLSLPHNWNPNRFTGSSIYFICGMNDNDLRNQAILEFKGLIPACNILFSKQLQKFNQTPKAETPITPSLVIIDESHYASFKSSQVDLFLKTVQHPEMLTLSVSATAMAEVASSTQLCKGKVYLRPGPDYYGMSDLFSNGRIFQSVDITTDQDKFIDLMVKEYEYQKEHADLKYNIVRLPSQWYFKDLEEELSELDLDLEFINHHSEHSNCQDFNQYTRTVPEKFTIIWIYGSLRAGKQLDTKNIGFVHDTAKSSPDIIAQSLMGRTLGYNKSHNFVRCYTDLQSAKLMFEWVKSAYDSMKIPIGSKGIVSGYSGKPGKWELHVPYLVNMDLEMRSHYRSLKQTHGNRYPYKYELFTDLALSATCDREDIIDILENYQPGECGGLMILTEKNKPKSFMDHWTHNYRAYLDEKFVHCCKINNPGKYFYVYVNLNVNSPHYGMALITYKEHIDVGGDAERAAVKVKSCSRFTET